MNFPVVAGGTALVLTAVVAPVVTAPFGGAIGLLLAGTAGVGVLGLGTINNKIKIIQGF